MSQRARVCFGLVTATALALIALGCGDDDSAEDSAEVGSSADRYCELSRELDRSGRELFEALEEDPSATREDFEAVERQLVAENEDALTEIQAAAPSEIEDQVVTLVQALRARAGLAEEMPSGVAAAEKRIDDFERENCE